MRNLRWRPLLWFGGGIGALLLLNGFIALLVAMRSLNREHIRFTQDYLQQFCEWTKLDQPDLGRWIEEHWQPSSRGFYMQIIGRDGRVIVASKGFPSGAPETVVPRRRVEQIQSIVIEKGYLTGGNEVRIGTGPIFVGEGPARQIAAFGQLIVPAKPYSDQAGLLFFWLLFSIGLTWLVAMVVAWRLISRWGFELDHFRDTAREISAATLSRRRLPISSNRDIGRLSHAFNEMLDRLDRFFDTQRRFVADAAHELRTPLTVMRGEIDVTLRRPREAEQYEEILRSNLEEIERLTQLTENLLLLAQAEVGNAREQGIDLDLGDLVHTAVERLRPIAREQQVRLDVTTEGALGVRGDAVSLSRVLTNLVDNALRHTPEGEQVAVTCARQGDRVLLEVSDRGVGIPPHDLPHIFDRFYRVDRARGRSSGGAGLGLAIVRAIVEAHGGTVTAQSEVGRGSCFRVVLPAV